MFHINTYRPRKIICPADCDNGKFYNEPSPVCTKSQPNLKEDCSNTLCKNCNGIDKGKGKVPKLPTVCTNCDGAGWIFQ